MNEIKSQLDVPLPAPVEDRRREEYRVLFVGNSITLHDFNDDTVSRLGWGHRAGMAASCEKNSYTHRFCDIIQKKLPARVVKKYFHTCGGGGSIALRLSAVDQVLPIRPDLVVIQMGEHEHEEDGEEALRINYEYLVSVFREQSPAPQLICIGKWEPDDAPRGAYQGWNARVDDVMRDVCVRRGVPFISVEKYALDSSCRGWGRHPGVCWHPNDKGHFCYAQELAGCFKRVCEIYNKGSLL